MAYRDALLLISALLLSGLAAWRQLPRPQAALAPGLESAAGVIDASGQWIPAGDYQRIAALSTVACQVLPDLISLNRIVLVSYWHQRHARSAFRTQGIPVIEGADQIEIILAARPDLVIINNFQMQPAVVDRLRRLGLTVFDLGGLEGPPTLIPNIRDLATVVGEAERGARLARQLQQRLSMVAAHVPADQRLRAIYLDRHGDQLIGGTEGSSFHHLLRYAGLEDVAAGRGLSPWPQIRAEQLLQWAPEIIVTSAGMAEHIPLLPGLRSLEARIVELPRGFDSTGPEILEHVEDLFQAVYGEL
ncbi:MAG: ABC transporter substrate-binding protein [Planctomycetota bacterium]|nr:MAG: ABC transporter substrate-binding protein [Planctomycetota bacterium]